MADATIRAFAAAADAAGVKVQVFGQSQDNARAFWNWKFIPDLPELPQTRAMLMRACDVRLPVQLSLEDIDAIAEVILTALAQVTNAKAA
jgi:hypothetical protein